MKDLSKLDEIRKEYAQLILEAQQDSDWVRVALLTAEFDAESAEVLESL